MVALKVMLAVVAVVVTVIGVKLNGSNKSSAVMEHSEAEERPVRRHEEFWESHWPPACWHSQLKRSGAEIIQRSSPYTESATQAEQGSVQKGDRPDEVEVVTTGGET